MRLTITDISLHVPPMAASHSRLGTVVRSTYGHLYEAAGEQSRPPTVRRGLTRMGCAAYEAPTAQPHERSTDMASTVVGRLLSSRETDETPVHMVLHAQCTLDQQILASGCLRVQHDHFPQASAAMTLGQVGTAGVVTALQLALIQLADAPTEKVCISAADKWIAPFFRRIEAVTTYGDAAGACLVRRSVAAEGIAEILDMSVSVNAPEQDIWTMPPERIRAWLASAVSADIERVAVGLPSEQLHRVALVGDGYNGRLLEAICARLSWSPSLLRQPLTDIHLSSASPLASLSCAIEAASREGREGLAIVWTASLSGHTAAMLVRCTARAVATQSGWTTGSDKPPLRVNARGLP